MGCGPTSASRLRGPLGVTVTSPHPPHPALSSVHWVTEAMVLQWVALVCDVLVDIRPRHTICATSFGFLFITVQFEDVNKGSGNRKQRRSEQ